MIAAPSLRPPFPYFGGKIRLAPWIASLLPPHRVYVEPFAGSAAVLLAKPRAQHEVLNDLDGDVVNFFRTLRDNPAELERVCVLTPYARDEYTAARLDKDDLGDVERARRFWVRCSQGFARAPVAGTGWSVGARGSQSPPARVVVHAARLAALAERLRTVTIESAPGADVIRRLAVTTDTVVYADPPYVVSATRTRHAYPLVMTDDEHRDLAEALRSTPATVLLSGYPSPLYEDLYADWHRVDRPIHRPTANVAGDGGAPGIEALWSNRPFHAPAPTLFDLTEGAT